MSHYLNNFTRVNVLLDGTENLVGSNPVMNSIFSSFMRTHAKAINEYCGGEMSTEAVVDRNLWTEIVDLRRK